MLKDLKNMTSILPMISEPNQSGVILQGFGLHMKSNSPSNKIS